ncbi:MAG: hypothetical protein ABIS07_00780 [Dokdonella sp.]
MSIKRSALSTGLVVALLALVPGFAAAQKDMKSDMQVTPVDAKIELRNDSKWSIQQLFLASVDSSKWGADQLGHHTLKTGSTFTLSEISCGNYDVKLIDEDADECIVKNISLCSTSKVWTLTDKDLMKCEAHTPQ